MPVDDDGDDDTEDDDDYDDDDDDDYDDDDLDIIIDLISAPAQILSNSLPHTLLHLKKTF